MYRLTLIVTQGRRRGLQGRGGALPSNTTPYVVNPEPYTLLPYPCIYHDTL